MKKKIYYLAIYIVILFAQIVQATDNPTPSNDNEEAIKILIEIIKDEFPLVLYDKNDDRCENDQKLVAEASAAAKTQGADIFLIVPFDVLAHHIFPYFDRTTLLYRVPLTCRSFNFLSKLSKFYLNEYCLTEDRIHSIPPSVRLEKTLATPNGLVKLAGLWTVKPSDLASWFDEPQLRSSLTSPYVRDILESDFNKNLSQLYHCFKLVIAYSLKCGTNEPTTPEVKQFISKVRDYYFDHRDIPGFSDIRGFSYDLLRLCTFSPLHGDSYYQILAELFERFYNPPALSETPTSTDITTNYSTVGFQESTMIPTPSLTMTAETAKLVAKELLLSGKSVVLVNRKYFLPNPDKHNVAGQVMNWCLQYPACSSVFAEVQNPDESLLTFIDQAQKLRRLDVAQKMLGHILNESDQLLKMRAVAKFVGEKIDDENVLALRKQFIREFFSLRRVTKIGENENQFLPLMLCYVEEKDVSVAINYMLSAFQNDFISDLVYFIDRSQALTHNPILVKQLMATLIDQPEILVTRDQLPGSSLLRLGASIDFAKTIQLLKDVVSSDQTSTLQKIRSLNSIARFALDQEKSYLGQHATLINARAREKGLSPLNFSEMLELSILYMHLDDLESCDYYFINGIQSLRSHPLGEIILGEIFKGIQAKDIDGFMSLGAINVMKYFDAAASK